MSQHRNDIVDRILAERARQYHLPGSEFDGKNSPNDWIAISIHYLSEEIRRAGSLPDKESFEDSLVKAAAVILAALENVNNMDADNAFSKTG